MATIEQDRTRAEALADIQAAKELIAATRVKAAKAGIKLSTKLKRTQRERFMTFGGTWTKFHISNMLPNADTVLQITEAEMKFQKLSARLANEEKDSDIYELLSESAEIQKQNVLNLKYRAGGNGASKDECDKARNLIVAAIKSGFVTDTEVAAMANIFASRMQLAAVEK